ncbi:MAG: hypothetical protein ACRDLP_00065 [Solirubrobacteraceae bacterium]
MGASYRQRDCGEPHGRQPRYDALVRRAGCFYLMTRLPSGKRVAVRLGRPSRRQGPRG